MKVLAQVRVSLYAPRGDYQLIVRTMEEAGVGSLQRAFEKLKAQLQAEGLFAAERKKPLPASRAALGYWDYHSPTGAAVRDVLTVLQRRCPSIPVILYPSAVQGKGAADELVQALSVAIVAPNATCLFLVEGEALSKIFGRSTKEK